MPLYSIELRLLITNTKEDLINKDNRDEAITGLHQCLNLTRNGMMQKQMRENE